MEDILECGLFPEIETKELGREGGKAKWIWQQDGASKPTAQFLKGYLWVGRWITECMPNSPDCSPLDFSVCGILQERAAGDKAKTLAVLRGNAHKHCAQLESDVVKRACAGVPSRLRALIAAGGGHFEHEFGEK